ncbi:MAG: histidinol-phosphatase HisJ [Promethearchaeota archaeon]
MDHHVHTYRCNHATGTEEEYILAAIEKGLDFIGFNEHFPMRYLPETIPVEDYAMELDEFPGFIETLRALQVKYDGQIAIKIGAEVDYFQPAWKAIQDTIHPFLDVFDYLYGSVHVIDDWAVDDDRFEDKWAKVDNDLVWKKYYEANLSMVQTGFFDVVGHMDLPKKYKHFPTRSLDDLIIPLLQAIKTQDMLVEVNTAGLRKPVKEIYPSKHVLELCREHGVKLTLGSDAHAPGEVGYAFKEVIKILKDVGFDRIFTLTKRKMKAIELE